MISLLLTFLISSILMGVAATFMGYCVHWVFHQPWSLWFYNAHMNHHKIQYPATDFYSDKYRSAGKDSTVILFVVVFIPIILIMSLLALFGIISWTLGVYCLLNLIAWGLIHNYFHDQFHLNNSFWHSFNIFDKLRELHYIHHLEMNTNYGIVVFQWDKLFKTYVEAAPLSMQGEK